MRQSHPSTPASNHFQANPSNRDPTHPTRFQGTILGFPRDPSRVMAQDLVIQLVQSRPPISARKGSDRLMIPITSDHLQLNAIPAPTLSLTILADRKGQPTFLSYPIQAASNPISIPIPIPIPNPKSVLRESEPTSSHELLQILIITVIRQVPNVDPILALADLGVRVCLIGRGIHRSPDRLLPFMTRRTESPSTVQWRRGDWTTAVAAPIPVAVAVAVARAGTGARVGRGTTAVVSRFVRRAGAGARVGPAAVLRGHTISLQSHS